MMRVGQGLVALNILGDKECAIFDISASVGLACVVHSFGGMHVFLRAAAERNDATKSLCGVHGLAALASCEKARGDMEAAKVEEVLVVAMLASELERARASQQRDVFEAALERGIRDKSVAAHEITELQRHLDAVKENMQRLDHNVSTDTSQLLAWGSFALTFLSQGKPYMHRRILTCGGVEAMVVALKKAHVHDKTAVIEAMRAMVDDSPVRFEMRAMLSQVLSAMHALPEDVNVQKEGLGVVRAFAKDQQSHMIILDQLEAVFTGLHHNAQDSGLQELGLDVVLLMVDSESGGNVAVRETHSDTQSLSLARQKVGQQGGIVATINVLKNFVGRLEITRMALHNLWNLAMNEPLNRKRIWKERGLEVALASMRYHANDIAIQAHGLRLMWKVAWNEPPIQSSIVELGGVNLLLKAMRSHSTSTWISTSGCWALFSLVRSRNEFNRNAVLRAGALLTVVNAIKLHGSTDGVMTLCTPVQQMLVLANDPVSKSAPSGQPPPSQTRKGTSESKHNAHSRTQQKEKEAKKEESLKKTSEYLHHQILLLSDQPDTSAETAEFQEMELKWFLKLDVDQSGGVTWPEAQHSNLFGLSNKKNAIFNWFRSTAAPVDFITMDVDKNGFLTIDEFVMLSRPMCFPN